VLGGSSLDFLVRVAGGLGRGRGALGRARAAGGFLVNARRIFGGGAAHCELAENLARRLGWGPAVLDFIREIIADGVPA
jgi:hypothetical protein